MADQDRGQGRPLSRALSRRSGASRPRTPDNGLARITSGNHIDDNSQPVGHEYHADRELDHGSGQSAAEDEDNNTSEDDGNENASRDVEAAPDLEKVKSIRSVRDPNLITWNGPDDPENPINWKQGRKWMALLIISTFTFISPVSSSMVAPALPAISEEFHIHGSVEASLTVSIFILAYAIGPLVFGPLSEIYGRVVVLQTSNLLYLFFNLGCGLAQNKTQLIIFRLLSGLGGSAPLAIGGGLLSDLFRPDERGKATSVYSLGPLLGPAVGPIAGGFIAQRTTWRWVFYATTIVDGLVQFVGLFFLQETYPPVVLNRKKLRLTKETGNTALYTEYDKLNRKLSKTLKVALSRPFIMLGSQIIIQVLAIYMAFIYGTLYIVLISFPALWSKTYHENVGIGGLNYISLGIGFTLGAQVCAPLQDRIYRALRRRNDGVGKAEFRVPLMFPGAIITPVGLFWYGWSAHAQLHWIMPNIGAALFTAGAIIEYQCIQTYLVDAYTRYAASAFAATTVLRSLAGFAFPLFAPAMYDALGYGWGNSVLGFTAIVLGWIGPIMLWYYGATLRAKSTFASG